MIFQELKFKITGYNSQFSTIDSARKFLKKKQANLILKSRNINCTTEEWVNQNTGKIYKISIYV